MAGLPWFELDVDFSEHPKVLALCATLREPLADAYVARLWAYCYRQATDRLPGAAGPGMVELAARWRGRPGVLVAAMLEAGVLDRDGQDLVAHGVAERLEPHLAKRAHDAVRQQRRRHKAAAGLRRPLDVTRDEPRDVPPDVTRESLGDKDKDKDNEAKTLPLACAREAGAMARAEVLAGMDETFAQKYPRTDELLRACAAAGLVLAWPKAGSGRSAAEAAIGDQPVAAIVPRVAESVAENGKPWLGWHLDAIRGAGRRPAHRSSAIAAPAPHEAFGAGGERVIE